MLTLRVVLDKTTILGVAVAPENFEGDLIGGHLQLMILNFSSTPVKPWVRHIILQPLQGVHAARKISARKIPKNSSSWSVIDISALSLSILRERMSGKNNNSSQRRLPATLPSPPPKKESIPNSSSSALAIPNRFVPLGSPLGSTVGQFRPNYQTALASPYDPYSSMPSPSTPKTPSFAKSSPYVKKHPMEQLFSIPHHINKRQSLDKIVCEKMASKLEFPISGKRKTGREHQ
ncbi:uncharacterized protein [Malus domestica]|uniref:uncharacterized protein isoform X1 n=2 Tax=Malus domestica TaxID=3750 RepID=UPI003974CA3D